MFSKKHWLDFNAFEILKSILVVEWSQFVKRAVAHYIKAPCTNSFWQTNNRVKGAEDEKIAYDYLIKHGYKILETKYHFSKFAEIYIIACQNDILTLVEVKVRTTLKYDHPLEAISSTSYFIFTQSLVNNIYSFINIYFVDN